MKTQQRKPKWRQPGKTEHKRHMKRTTEDLPDNSTSSDDEMFGQTVINLKQLKKIKSDDKDKTLTMKMEDFNEDGRFQRRTRAR